MGHCTMYKHKKEKKKILLRTQSAITAFTQTSNHSKAKRKDMSEFQSFLRYGYTTFKTEVSKFYLTGSMTHIHRIHDSHTPSTSSFPLCSKACIKAKK